MNLRKETLEKLIKFDGDLNEILKTLSEFEWDSDNHLVILQSDDIVFVLNKYLSGEISSKQVEICIN